MEPDYSALDPVERTNKFLALFSIIFGVLSLCSGLIPIAGIITSVIGIVTGFYGRKSEQKKMALVGIIISAFGLLISIVYALFLLVIKIGGN
jgi:hypothetical protein